MIDIDMLKNTVGIEYRTAAVFKFDEYSLKEVSRCLESHGITVYKNILRDGREYAFTLNCGSTEAIFARTHVFTDIRYNLISLSQFDMQDDIIIESDTNIEEELL